MHTVTTLHPGAQVDVHVLDYPGIARDDLKRCLRSLRDEPINLHVIDNDSGSILQGRLAGYAKGTAPYVAYVDADDYVEPLIADVMDRMVESGAKALFTNFWVHQLGSAVLFAQPGVPYSVKTELSGGPCPHQLFICKREYIHAIYRRMQGRLGLAGLLDMTCDLASTREISLDDAWGYFDQPTYHWMSSMKGAHYIHACEFSKVFQFYRKLM